jgi:undecaprenyl diphosphate synthase
MDGNRRWAQQRMLPAIFGHRAGAERVRDLVKACAAREVESLSIFAFSTENWRRPSGEVTGLMALLRRYLQREVGELEKESVRLRVIGDRSRFSPVIQNLIANAEAQTAQGTRLCLNLAVNYGGQLDMVQAVQRWQAEHPTQNVQDLSPEALSPYLATADGPAPDLLIRTGGECRISNFMIWQLAYTELYFTPMLWPDFQEQHLDEAIRWYQERDRRFGGVSQKYG